MVLERHTGRGREREKTVADVLLGALALPKEGSILVADDPHSYVARGIQADGVHVERYWRVATMEHPASPWTSGGPYDAATLRLSKDKVAFTMAAHAVASVLKPSAALWIYGANDEGIKSASKKLSPLFTDIETIDTRRHCRVIRARLSDTREGLRAQLQDWAQTVQLEHANGPTSHRVYPGIFAKGQLDPATALLLEAMDAPKPNSRVLDYACGAGVIGAELLRREDSIDLTLMDADAVAIVATQENVPGGTARIEADPMAISKLAPFDLIVSNPPIHDGKARDYKVVQRLIESAARHLNPGAPLWMVVQRQVPVAEHLNTHLAGAVCVKSDGRFQVWRAIRP